MNANLTYDATLIGALNALLPASTTSGAPNTTQAPQLATDDDDDDFSTVLIIVVCLMGLMICVVIVVVSQHLRLSKRLLSVAVGSSQRDQKDVRALSC